MPFADTWPDISRCAGGGLAVRAKGETGRRSYPCEPLTRSADEADQGAQGRPQERDEREPGEPVSAGAPRRGGERYRALGRDGCLGRTGRLVAVAAAIATTTPRRLRGPRRPPRRPRGRAAR